MLCDHKNRIGYRLMYRVEEVKGRSEEAETGTQPASSIYSAPGVAVGAEVSPYALSQQY